MAQNKYIEIRDLNTIQFKTILDDIHDFLKVSERKKNSFERCSGNSLIEPAVFESYKHWDNPWAISNANLENNMKILDCGSGRGILQFYLAGKGIEVHSIDVSHNRSRLFKKIKTNLKKVRINYKLDPNIVHKKLNKKYNVSVKFKMESAADISYPDNFFDRIFCISVIEHMEDLIIKKSIKEMERVLKPKGLLLLTFDFHPFPDDNIIGFTGKDFTNKVLNKCKLKIAGNIPDYKINNWNKYIEEINNTFNVTNPNTSYGIVLRAS